MRILAALVAITLLLPTLGGCSVPRGAMLKNIIQNEIPAPPSSKATNFSASGLLIPDMNPGGQIVYQCSMGSRDTITWYANELAKRGWTLSYDNKNGWPPPATAPGGADDKYRATRIRWQVGDIIVLREELRIDFRSDEVKSPNTCVITFTLGEDSLFDKPAQGFESILLMPFDKKNSDLKLMATIWMVPLFAIF